MTRLTIFLTSLLLFISCKNNDKKSLEILLNYEIKKNLQDYKYSKIIIQYSTRKKPNKTNSIGKLSKKVDSCIEKIKNSLPKINGYQNKLKFASSTLTFINQNVTNTFYGFENPELNLPEIKSYYTNNPFFDKLIYRDLLIFGKSLNDALLSGKLEPIHQFDYQIETFKTHKNNIFLINSNYLKKQHLEINNIKILDNNQHELYINGSSYYEPHLTYSLAEYKEKDFFIIEADIYDHETRIYNRKKAELRINNNYPEELFYINDY